MTAKEAYRILMFSGKAGRRQGVNCFEYKDIFTFELRRNEELDKPLFDSVYSVNKTTKEVKVFSPFNMDVNDYETGKEIKDFK